VGKVGKVLDKLGMGSTSTKWQAMLTSKPAAPDPTRECWPFHAMVIVDKMTFICKQ